MKNPKFNALVLMLCLLLLIAVILTFNDVSAQTVIDWRTVVASITPGTPTPMTATTPARMQYTWTPSPPFRVSTRLPGPTETPTAIEIRPVEYITVEVTRIIYVVVTATPTRFREPNLPDADIPVIPIEPLDPQEP